MERKAYPSDISDEDRDQVQQLTQKVQEVTSKTVEVAFVDEG